MNGNLALNELKRLNFENYLWILVSSLALLSILGNQNDKAFIETNNINYKLNANKTFELTLIISLFIYIYYFYRNYNNYKKASPQNRELLIVKLFGSALFIAATILLLYFQYNDRSFIGSPAI